MTLLDYTVLAIIGVSVLISVWRGAVREVLALGAWVFAFLAGQAYADPVSVHVPGGVASPSLRLLLGFVVVFLAVLLLTSLLAAAISRLMQLTGLGPVDRGLGAIFGLVRGILVVMILVLLGGLTEMPRTSAWREAMLSAPLEAAASGLTPFLPYGMASRVRFD